MPAEKRASNAEGALWPFCSCIARSISVTWHFPASGSSGTPTTPCFTQEPTTGGMRAQRIREQLQPCHLDLHPGKTRIVSCKDIDRTEDNPCRRSSETGRGHQGHMERQMRLSPFCPRRCRRAHGDPSSCSVDLQPSTYRENAKACRAASSIWASSALSLRSRQTLMSLPTPPPILTKGSMTTAPP